MASKSICLHAKSLFRIGDGKRARGVGATVGTTTHVGFRLPVGLDGAASLPCCICKTLVYLGNQQDNMHDPNTPRAKLSLHTEFRANRHQQETDRECQGKHLAKSVAPEPDGAFHLHQTSLQTIHSKDLFTESSNKIAPTIHFSR